MTSSDEITHVTALPTGWRAAVAVVHEFVQTSELAVEIVITPVIAINTYADGTQRFAYLSAHGRGKATERSSTDIHDKAQFVEKFSDAKRLTTYTQRVERILPPGAEYTLAQQQADKDQTMSFLEARCSFEGLPFTWHDSNVEYRRR